MMWLSQQSILLGGLFPFGLIVGSFLNVIIHRLPRKQSIVVPGSHCPQCRNPIRAWDNIPLLSYLWLRGKCRHCNTSISLRYPMVELFTGLLFLAVGLHFGIHLVIIPLLVMVAALIATAYIDIDFQIIPDIITLPLSLAGIIVSAIQFTLKIVFNLNIQIWPIGFTQALMGGAIGYGVLLAFYQGYYFVTGREGMGGGDLKLLGLVGIFLGWKQALLTLFLASFLGSLLSMPLLMLGKKGKLSKIVFGPFLAIGALIALFYGETLIQGYLLLMKHPQY